jgi:hypothetical protein
MLIPEQVGRDRLCPQQKSSSLFIVSMRSLLLAPQADVD